MRLILGSLISTWNAIYAFDWSLVWVFVRVTIDCTIVDGPLVLQQFGEDLGIALELLFIAVADYLEGKQGPLLTSGIDFEPFVEQIGVTANTTALLFNCACLVRRRLVVVLVLPPSRVFELEHDSDPLARG